jgi:kumamolisin
MIQNLNRSLLFVAVTAVLTSPVSQAQTRQTMTHHMREVTRTGAARSMGRLPSNQIMQLNLVLPLSDSAGLDAFLKDIYNPVSPNFRHYLTVSQFTQRFGPSQESYDAVVKFANSNGFEVVGGSRDGMDVQVKGPVSAVENAFHVTMNNYQHPTENRIFFGPDREPTTTNLNVTLWHVSGLDNFSVPKPRLINRKDYAYAHDMDPEAVVSHATTGSGPSASFLGSDMRAAYYGNGGLDGAGQYIGLLEYYGTDLADVTTYYKNVGQTNYVKITLISTDGTSTSCVDSGRNGCDDTEQTLDITQALGMAPRLSGLYMFVGSTDTAMISAMTTKTPLASAIGCSWGWTPADPKTLDPYFLRMAAQGQTFFAASGDASTWSSRNEAWPADDANVVSVGGTDLVTTGGGGSWMSETAWVDSGGGISPDSIAIPSWQQIAGVINSTNKGSTTLRNGPDVSANANFTFYVCADQTTCTANSYGGTSFAAPMWAGLIALANQQAFTSGKPAVGFLNPTIYAQNVGSSYGADFHDVTSGKSGSYSAVTGYDLVTGWGSPNSNLITALLSGSSSTPSLSVSASPAAVSVVQGKSGSTTITTTGSGGFASSVALSLSGAPSGVTATFNPASIGSPGSGTSTLTLAVASTTATGSYPLTIKAAGGGLTSTTIVTLTVTGTGSGSFAVAVSPTSGTISRGRSGSATVTTTVSGGFSSAISLSSTGQPTGVTVSFSPASIAAPGSGTAHMNISVARSAARGTYLITVTGTGGGSSHTATLNLTVH